jgi:Histidine kinase-, DNA gyrase B-, and HSP90-like ATPase
MSTTTDKPRLVVPDKSFFVKERSSLYNQWLISWWRENMQNSVDAGAKTIRIDISDAAPKGSFGREPDPGRVTRVVFADDGIGMDAPTIDNVFFRMGATTKDDETSVGGFGRARIMTCFSQVRYSIETRDRYVEGDGPEFLNFSRSEAIDALERWQQASSDRATAAGDDAKTALNRDATDAIAADRARLVSASSFAGCRLEVDLPPDERDRNGHRSTPEGMLNTLQVYLAQSDLKCEVIINGESYQKPSVKYAKRKALYATIGKDAIDQSWIANRRIETKLRPDGDYDVKFATVRIIPSEDAPQGTREKLIFRVHGASMFSEYTSVNAGLFLEIEPAIARQVLTANRDGLKEPFSSAVEDYKRLLATDAQQATKGDSGPEFTLLPGGLGRKIARRRLKEDDLTTAEAEAITGEAGRTLAESIRGQDRHVSYRDASWTWGDFETGDLKGLDPNLLKPFLEKIALTGDIAGTFLENFLERTKAESFAVTLKNSGPHRAMVLASGNLLGFIIDNLALQKAAADVIAREAYKDRLSDFNDVPILKENMEPPAERFSPEDARRRRAKLVSAAHRNDPRNWDPATGKGLAPRRLLAAWQAAVDAVVTEMLEAYPHVKEFAYSSGWVFSHPQWAYSSVNGEYGFRSPAAMLKKDKAGGDVNCHFLLDPLDAEKNFTLKYNPTDPDDRDRLIALAAHEAGHAIVDHGHNDAFAEVLTTLMERLTTRVRRQIHKDMMASIKAVDLVYARKKSRVIPLDDQKGMRPSERLAAGCGLARPTLAHDGTLEFDADHPFEAAAEPAPTFSV